MFCSLPVQKNEDNNNKKKKTDKEMKIKLCSVKLFL